ncbi:MAG TPA: L,D-transpeptidase [Acidobacteriota bacterium]|nr:L,D-transpeptidase [Acidobacteriota bacterium]HNT18439.1 L,D-transpeptidase [Acidobacteriota bacterium]HPA26720.1 L,D-transpeptidase [Acidobacteriota bacterium]HQO20245.1 L,D-transpeptidase [Acidobacteriota bacterium]HQQ46912.1 L,D-transpeptidase [Acidobacteriota bacterium]
MTGTGNATLYDVTNDDLAAKKMPRVLVVVLVLLSILLLGSSLFLAVFLGTGYDSRIITEELLVSGRQAPSHSERSDPQTALAEAEKITEGLLPKKYFIVIDRVHNRLWLREGERTDLEALISAGAGSVLKDPKGDREWVFDTPMGRFKVKGRREKPLWTAPDWDYIEANEPFPKNYADRVEEGSLGEYALDLDVPGYMIHGTLYTRLIGRNVSHGCIRVGRDDLRVLWKKSPVGSAVFIF